MIQHHWPITIILLWEFFLGHQQWFRAKSTVALIFIVLGFMLGYAFEILILRGGNNADSNFKRSR